MVGALAWGVYDTKYWSSLFRIKSLLKNILLYAILSKYGEKEVDDEHGEDPLFHKFTQDLHEHKDNHAYPRHPEYNNRHPVSYAWA